MENVAEDMTRSKLMILIVAVTGFLFESCDPYYSIRIQNLTQDTVSVVALTTVHFYSDDDYKVLGEQDGDQKIMLRISPGKYADCGNAIGELEDDLPFRELRIDVRQDAIVATNP